jgi:hypothetical protein
MNITLPLSNLAWLRTTIRILRQSVVYRFYLLTDFSINNN